MREGRSSREHHVCISGEETSKTVWKGRQGHKEEVVERRLGWMYRNGRHIMEREV
jgi:hypothetical protein